MTRPMFVFAVLVALIIAIINGLRQPPQPARPEPQKIGTADPVQPISEMEASAIASCMLSGHAAMFDKTGKLMGCGDSRRTKLTR